MKELDGHADAGIQNVNAGNLGGIQEKYDEISVVMERIKAET